MLNSIKSTVALTASAMISSFAPIWMMLCYMILFFVAETITSLMCHFESKSRRKNYKKRSLVILKSNISSSLLALITIVLAFALESIIIESDLGLYRIVITIFCASSFLKVVKDCAYITNNKSFKAVKRKTDAVFSKL